MEGAKKSGCWRLAGLLFLCGGGFGAWPAQRPACALSWIEAEGAKEWGIREGLDARTEADEIDADFTLDPTGRRIRGTASLRFSPPGGLKTFDLCAELEIDGLCASDPAARLFRLGDRVYVLGEGLSEIRVGYHGLIRRERSGLHEKMLVLDDAGSRETGAMTTLFSRTLPFIPSSNQRFAQVRLSADLPAGGQCLMSGMKREKTSAGLGARYVFESRGSRGVALSWGDFRMAERVEAAVPVNLYVAPGLQLDLDAYRKRLRQVADFFVSRFGPPGVPELNLLVQGESFNGGCSFGGFLIHSVRADNGPTSVPDADFLPPMFLYDCLWDSLIHEFAHQWWGGVVSGQRTGDAWISEGLAQYSTLLYWRENLPERRFAGILERMCAGIVQKAGAGRVSDSVKMALVQQDPVSFQVIVYNKAALVFWMLRDLMGEKWMMAALRRLLAERRHQCLGGDDFVGQLAGGDPLLQRFFSGWVGRAEVPSLAYRLRECGGEAWLDVGQSNGPFVFPLEVRCRTRSGLRRLRFTVQRERESFLLDADSGRLRSLEIRAGQIPVRVGGPVDW